jgi:hypothetical protein
MSRGPRGATAVRIGAGPAAGLLLCALGCGGGATTGEGEAYTQRRDPRIAPLFEGCTKNDFYDRNVADVIPILVEKLERSARDPLTRAKEELTAAGAAAIPPLQRLVQRHYAEPHGAPVLSNALDVLKGNRAPEAHEILLLCLDHPGASVRLLAIQALHLGHARPEDFDVLRAHLEIEDPEQRHQVALALHAADPARAEAEYLDWVERGERPGLLRYAAPLIAGSTQPETARRAAGLYASATPAMAPYLAAAAAAAGDEAALGFLNAELDRTENPADVQRRSGAVVAAVEAHLYDLLRRVMATEPDGNLRTIAATAIGSAPDAGPDALAALAYGLDDLKPAVRTACLGALVERGDAMGIDRALALLDGTTSALQEGMTALFRRLPSDPDTAARAFEALRQRDQLEDFLPLRQRTATLKSLGEVPTAAAAELLIKRAREHPAERVEGLPAHQWMTIHAANTGPAGRAWLLGELAHERDPARRLDLLWAGTGARTDAARAELRRLIESGELSPDELLFACNRLLSLGPAADVAPFLKRVAPQIEDVDVRLALQCLLWTWY